MDIGEWEQAIAAIIAVGALGTAAFGVVEALGKALVIRRFGLPYVGFKCVLAVIEEFKDALYFTYGKHYELILAQQYRNDRSSGSAPETIRQGVRLALPMMDGAQGKALVTRVWGLGDDKSAALVDALQAEKSGPLSAAEADAAATLAARFALALDSRIASAFTLAEERYQATARLWAGLAAIGLSLLFNMGLRSAPTGASGTEQGYPWLVALLIGAAAVPLAPVAKDLSSALSDALKAWRQVGAPPKA
jgi:hypothetical protein